MGAFEVQDVQQAPGKAPEAEAQQSRGEGRPDRLVPLPLTLPVATAAALAASGFALRAAVA
jgi:hypothetical protein